jgi:hypothetical protein
MRGKTKICSFAVLIVAVLFIAIPTFAHHGTNISYDHSKPVTLKGTVTQFRFNNPHAQIFFDVKDEKGNVVNWGGELTSPYNLAQGGWTKRRSESELKPGTPITITLAPSRAGTSVGVVLKILNEKGEQVLLGRDQQVE